MFGSLFKKREPNFLDFKEEKETAKRFVYSRDELMAYAHCKYVEEFPELLCNMEDNLAYKIIKPVSAMTALVFYPV